MSEREIVWLAVHGHPGHSSGPGRCGICEVDGVPLEGDVWLGASELSSESATLQVCVACLSTLVGLTRLAGTQGKLLKVELMRSGRGR